MDLEELKTKFRKYGKEDIIKEHAELQAWVRQIDLKEVKENVINPTKLVYAEKQTTKKENKEKYNCYFGYSKYHCHRYVLNINSKIIIVTIIDINRDWQKAIG